MVNRFIHARLARRFGSGAVVCAAVVLSARVAAAQITSEPTSPYPDPQLFARGWFVQAEGGAVIPLGPARDAIAGGPALGVRAGYEFFRWVALQVHAQGSTHTVGINGQPQAEQLLQILQASGELKLTVPLGAWSVFAQGGAGRARFSTNILGTAGYTDPGVRVSLVYGGGLGVDYHSRSRHFSAGLALGMNKFDRLVTTGLITAAVYLRYTF